MADEPDPDRLRALEARLKQVKGEAKEADVSVGTGFSQGEVAWRMIIELVTGMVIGMGIGYGLDLLFGTRPVCLIIFALLGFAAGVLTMLRTAEKSGEEIIVRSRKLFEAMSQERENRVAQRVETYPLIMVVVVVLFFLPALVILLAAPVYISVLEILRSF